MTFCEDCQKHINTFGDLRWEWAEFRAIFKTRYLPMSYNTGSDDNPCEFCLFLKLACPQIKGSDEEEIMRPNRINRKDLEYAIADGWHLNVRIPNPLEHDPSYAIFTQLSLYKASEYYKNPNLITERSKVGKVWDSAKDKFFDSKLNQSMEGGPTKHSRGWNREIVSSNTGSLETFEFAKWRINDCLQNHTLCSSDSADMKQSRQWSPTRLIYVGNATSGTVNLVETAENGKKSYPYITLSYRWGSDPKFYKLKTTNISDMKQGIKTQELASTFQDAIQAAKLLEISYIWIDALCIIQDSAEDWNAEAPKMAQVYGNAHATLAATGSEDAEGGLFHERTPTLLNGVRGLYFGKSKEEYVCVLPEGWSSRNMEEQSTLKERGWILQERLLSPRTLQFASDQVYWECNEMTACEFHPYGFQDFHWQSSNRMGAHDFLFRKLYFQIRKNPDDELSAATNLAELWEKLVENYSERKLTYESDRLIALSGIAKQIGSLIPRDEYLAGLWRSNFLRMLMWHNYPGGSRTQNATIPTWSWASVSGNKHFRALLIPGTPDGLVAEVVDISSSPVSDPYGAVKSGRAKLRGRLCVVEGVGIQDRAPQWTILPWLNGPQWSQAVLTVGTYQTSPYHTRVWIDTCDMVDSWRKTRKYHLFEILKNAANYRTTVLNDISASSGLVLERVEGSVGTYRRVGTYEINKTDNIMDAMRRGVKDGLDDYKVIEKHFSESNLDKDDFEKHDESNMFTITII